MSRLNTIAIAGAGFSGLMAALHLLRKSKTATVLLVERAAEFGPGVAYATSDPRHLLNVRASNMSAFPDDPDHFAAWLAKTAPGAAPQAFAPRHLFGSYLQSLLREALPNPADISRLVCIRDEADGIIESAAGIALILRSGRVLEPGHVILATGNLPPHDVPGLEANLVESSLYLGNPWAAGDYDRIGAADRILLIGTGLTAIDVLLTLERRGHRGQVMAISRRGLFPLCHAESGPLPAIYDLPSGLSLPQLVRFVRREAKTRNDWRIAADGLRPHIQRLWREASLAQRSQFLRHLRPYWDIHRHRIAPPVAAATDRLMADGRFLVYAGKILSGRLYGGEAEILWRRRGQTGAGTIRVDRIINCTGPAGDIRKAQSPLFTGMIGQGLARPDVHGLGLDVDRECRIISNDGHPSQTLSAIGPISRGAFWEVTAVPDIRVQAVLLADRLSS